MTNFNNTRNRAKQGVKSKFIVAFIAFALIIGVKALSSKNNHKETIRISIVD